MARPHKQTVDYFPHDTDASDGKTLTIIQSKYGNDGYAFWFKLLQLLGKTSGHYYDFNNPADWEFLLAKTHQNDTETTKAILNMLAVMGAIDTELYAQNIIWCQKFVDRIADAYDRTVDGVPSKPQPKESLRQLAERLEVSESYLSQVTTGDRLASDKLLKKCLSLGIDIKGVNVSNQGVSVDINSAYSAETPENTTETPQTKLKETKREERGGELSTSQEYLFNILLRCPAIKKDDSAKLPELLKDYPGIKYELEFKKFVEWWPGPNKRKKPWVVLRNWLGQARPDDTKLTDSGRYKKL